VANLLRKDRRLQGKDTSQVAPSKRSPRKSTRRPPVPKEPVKQPESSSLPSLKAWLKKCCGILGDIFYGMTVYEMVRELEKERAQVEHLFVLITMGDLLGIPILPPYYSLRLLPYAVPKIAIWRRSMLRERDVIDLTNFET